MARSFFYIELNMIKCKTTKLIKNLNNDIGNYRDEL